MPEPVRILALDHFSEQDRSALADAGGEAFEWRTVPYWRLRNAANKLLPADVQQGLAAYARAGLASQRERFAAWTRQEVRRLYREWPFDVFLLPSDAYYYVRELPDACHKLGIPLVVVQKETTITDNFFEEHAPDVRAHAPFAADLMTVCSERHKRFWVETGADPDRIVVTGQPRFDVYLDPPASLTWESLGLDDRRPTILFLSFETDAYLLDPADREVGWAALRTEIEETLAAASAGGTRVLVKLHPMQDEAAEGPRLRARYGSALELVPTQTDTRHLILLADGVVGFQTTALYEAMIAGKAVAYAAWGSLYERYASILIPFESHGDLLDVLRSPADVRAWSAALPRPAPERAVHRRVFVEETLGPVDGHASQRALDRIQEMHERWRKRTPGAVERRKLERLAPAAAAASLARAIVRSTALEALQEAAGVLPAATGDRLRRSTAFRLEREREIRRTARRTLSRRRRSA